MKCTHDIMTPEFLLCSNCRNILLEVKIMNYKDKVARLVAAVKNSQNDPLALALEIQKWEDA